MHCKTISAGSKLLHIDMSAVAIDILAMPNIDLRADGDPIIVSPDTRLWRFGIFEGGDLRYPDKIQIFVDGGGGYRAIIDPDTNVADTRDGHLSEFSESIASV